MFKFYIFQILTIVHTESRFLSQENYFHIKYDTNNLYRNDIKMEWHKT